jgi:hypothetical protein
LHEPKVLHQKLETIGFAKNIRIKENIEVVKETIEREKPKQSLTTSLDLGTGIPRNLCRL